VSPTAGRRAPPHLESRPPPTDATFGITDGLLADGTSWSSQRTPRELADEDGNTPAGALCLVADHALAAAIAGHLELEQAVVTTHMDVAVVRPIAAGRRIDGHGTLLAVTPSGCFATAAIFDEQGTALGHATGRFAVLNAYPTLRIAEPTVPPGRTVAPELLDGVPLHRFLGTRILHAGDGQAHVTVAAEPGFANGAGNLHGGVAGLAGEVANGVALRSAGAGGRMQVVEVRTTYLRPIQLHGQPVHTRATVTHLGRSLAVARSELLTDDRRTAVVVETVHSTPGGAPDDR
jgi:uncharacterized protein (TIGR00369 family)